MGQLRLTSTFALIVAGSLAFSLSAAFMKSTNGFTRVGPSAIVAAASLVGAVCLSRACMTESLSSAIIIGLGVEAVATLLISAVVFDERVLPIHAAGIALVIVGVGLLRVV